MKILILILSIFITVSSCKKNPNNFSLANRNNIQDNTKGGEEAILKTQRDTCEGIITRIVKSSNAEAVKNFSDLQIKIVEINFDKITIELFVQNDVSEDPSVRKISDQTVGWLWLYPKTKQLRDITSDIENPVDLIFDKNILSGNDLYKLCHINTMIRSAKDNDPDDKVNCYQKENGNFYFVDICEYDTLKNFTFLYSQMIKKFNEDDLLKVLPQADTTYSTASTPRIPYKLQKESIKIDVRSEGGATEYKLYRKNNKSFIEVAKSID